MTGKTLAAALVWAAGLSCTPPLAVIAHPRDPLASNVRELPSRPRVAVVARDGDPRGAIAVAVLTKGVDDAAGPRVPVALAALTLARLGAAGLADVTVAPTWDGYRVRALLPPTGDGATLVRAVRDALLTPVAPQELETVQRRLTTLAHRPLPDPAQGDAARCMDEPYSVDPADTPPPSIDAVERWRAGSHGLGRVVFGVTATPRAVDGVVAVILDQPTWPAGAPVVKGAPNPHAPSLVRVYDATADLGAALGRATVVIHTAEPSAAVVAAASLGARSAPLAERLSALDAPLVVRDITATAQAGRGCLAVTVDVTHAEGRDDDGAATLGEAVALVRQEAYEGIRVALATGHGPAGGQASLAEDPRESAELAAWWALVASAPTDGTDDGGESIVIGARGDRPVDVASRAPAIRTAVERAMAAWQTPVVEARREVEHGQGAVEILLASSCGTLAEGDADAGLSALAATALVEEARANLKDSDVELSEWVAADGVGLIVRATRRPQESMTELAHRAADVAGSAFFGGGTSAESAAIERARVALGTLAAQDESRGFTTLAEALVPGHPSWTSPWAAFGRGLEAWSSGAVVTRQGALRREPVRVAVLGNEDAAQVDAAVFAVDRWAPRPTEGTPGPRTCPASPPIPTDPPKAGTYAAPLAKSASAWIAVPLARGAGKGDARANAIATAAALDGPSGLLAHALSSGLASSWSARVVGPKDAGALVVRVVSPGPTLDTAVAQVRALLDRVRHGALTEADHDRAAARIAEDDLAKTLTAQGRLERLWRGEPKTRTVPSLEAMRAFAEGALHDDALVIVASRPPMAKVAP